MTLKFYPKLNAVKVTMVMLTDDNGIVNHIATVRINAMELVVEDWMIEKVSADAAKQLSKYVINSYKDYVEQ